MTLWMQTEFLPAPCPQQCVLVRPECGFHFDVQSQRHEDLVSSETDITIRHYSVHKNNNLWLSATQLILAPDTPAAVKSVLFQTFGMYFGG